jgi:hypothetical protein
MIFAMALVAGGLWGYAKTHGRFASDQTEPLSPDLYFTLESAPKPTPRQASDGLTQLIQLSGDLEQFRRHGGYSGQQVSQTLKEDPEAAKAMMGKFSVYVDRANRALTAPSAPYVFDPTDDNYPMVPGRGPGFLLIAEMLRAQESIHLQESDLRSANHDVDNLCRLANLVATIPSSYSIGEGKAIRGFALVVLEPFVNAYHRHPVERKELNEIIDRQRPRIPVIQRIQNDAYFAVRNAREGENKLPENQIEPYTAGLEQAYSILARLAKPSGDDFDAFFAKVRDLVAKEGVENDGSHRDFYSPANAKRSEVRKFIALVSIRANNEKRFTLSDDLLGAWFAAETYYDVHGKFPPSLDAAQFGSHTDPYSHQPLRYESNGSRIRVWSAGDHMSFDPRSGATPHEISLTAGS